MKNIAIISNYSFSLVAFRSHLIEDFIKRGYEVHALAPDYSPENSEHIRSIGAQPVDYYMERTGQNPVKDLRSLGSIIATLRKIGPDVTFSYGIKPVVYGLWASRLAGVKERYAMVAGLGTLYIRRDNESLKEWSGRKLANFLYRFSFPLARKVYFQNPDDIAFFREKGMIGNDKAVLVNGSGVDVSYYRSSQIQLKPLRFTLAARLIKEKGIYEFVKSARSISQDYPSKEITFTLLGDIDSNPNSVRHEELIAWQEEGIIEWPGRVSNIREWLEKTSIYVLPTYYREGTPRSILEAMAMSLPIITTDMPGCREAVEDRRNGFLIDPKNVRALTHAMEKFIDAPSLIETFGSESRKMAQDKYDVDIVNEQIMSAMEL